MLALFGVAGALRVIGFGGFVAAVWLCWLAAVVCDCGLVALVVYVCLLLPGILVVGCLFCFTGYCVAGGFSFAWFGFGYFSCWWVGVLLGCSGWFACLYNWFDALEFCGGFALWVFA